MGKSSTKAKNKYNNANYDRINFILPSGRKEELKQIAESAGYTSLNSFITDAVNSFAESHTANNGYSKFDDGDLKIECYQDWIEKEKVTLFCYFGEKFENISRVVKFDKDAGDLCVTIKGNKYFYSEFK